MGHERHVRPLVPPEKVDKRVVLKPKRCKGCHASLDGHDPAPRRHQVSDLPRVVPIVTEFELHALDCPSCGTRTVASLPAGVPTGAFGPSVVAAVAVLLGVYRLGKRAVPELMQDLFGLNMSLGAVIGCQRAASAALEVPVAEAKASVADQPVKNADETGWREGRKRAFLWVVVTATVTVFMVHARRTADAARELLTRSTGVLVTDRHGAYNWWPLKRHQFCWAHIERDVLAIAERGGDSKRVGDALLADIDRMFRWWHRVRDGTLARSTFRVYMRSLQLRVEALLAEGAAVDHPKTSGTCKKLLKVAEGLWTFVRVEGVEPTNNAAERAVRHGVLCRRMSHGTHSAQGSRFIERILTTHASLRQQGRNVLAFVREACVARLHGSPPPSLLTSTEQRVDVTLPVAA